MIHSLTLKAIAVEVPDDSRKHIITDSPDKGDFCICYEIVPIDDAPSWDISDNLPEGSWSILGRPEEMTEDQWAGIVSWFELAGKVGYMDYSFDDPRFPFGFATTSGTSFLKSKNIDPSKVIILQKQ